MPAPSLLGYLSAVPDASTTLAALKDVVRAFCEERDWDQFHGPRDLAERYPVAKARGSNRKYTEL